MADVPLVFIAESRFYAEIADRLAQGATEVLDKAGAPYVRHAVPGVFELPAAIRFAIRSMEAGAATQRFGGFIALGCVIRGETDHYRHIAREACRALMELSVVYSIALGFGVLTCDTLEQARDRADTAGRDKGGDAARACLQMMDLKKTLRLVMR